jgi:uncharacterized protein YbjQ (UPF0145 family)
MFVTTTFDIEGYKIREYRGVVRGIIVRSPIGSGPEAIMKVLSDDIGAFTETCDQARRQAHDVMVAHANELGANAVVGVRYDASQVTGGSVTDDRASALRRSRTEVLCYGTAVIVEPVK